jgi:hypothetical protein
MFTYQHPCLYGIGNPYHDVTLQANNIIPSYKFILKEKEMFVPIKLTTESPFL